MSKIINFLHINASDIHWGASLAGYRFHKALIEKGFGSHILCALKKSDDPHVSRVVPGSLGYIPNALVGSFFNALGLQSFGYPSSFFIKRSNRVTKWADVIILRNLHWWYFSIGMLPWLSKQAPLIWRVPDMWPLTGKCIYSYECKSWMNMCGSCPYLRDYPHLFFDTSRFLWQRKKKIYQKLKERLVFVSPSRWLKHKVENSPLTCDFRCELIPTAVDLHVFKNGQRAQARSQLTIQPDEKVIMFSSFKLSDPRKGLTSFLALVKAIKRRIKAPLTVLLVGAQADEVELSEDIRVIKTGLISQEEKLASHYNAADIYLSLSKADNLPNTLIEAAASGLPIVTFNSGGCAESLRQSETGYAVDDYEQMVAASVSLLEDEAKRSSFSHNARNFAESNFSMDRQVMQYVALAHELVEKNYA